MNNILSLVNRRAYTDLLSVCQNTDLRVSEDFTPRIREWKRRLGQFLKKLETRESKLISKEIIFSLTYNCSATMTLLINRRRQAVTMIKVFSGAPVFDNKEQTGHDSS